MSQDSAQWLLDEELQIFGLHVATSARQGKVLQGAQFMGLRLGFPSRCGGLV